MEYVKVFVFKRHLCVNITVGPAGIGGAVLLRGLETNDESQGIVWLPPEQKIGPVIALTRVGIRHEQDRLCRFSLRP